MPRSNEFGPAAGTEALEAADRLLAEIAVLSERVLVQEAEAEAEMESVRRKYRTVDDLRARLGELDRELKSLMKDRQNDIFLGQDKVSVRHGLLFHCRELKVFLPRGALGRLKELGWREAIRVAESVNRSVVEKWNAGRLAAIGAGRREVVRFAYEVRKT
ncbi:MAG: host-nuclease inhibitor Gam family protein [Thermodesulfobacteriota bacterium]